MNGHKTIQATILGPSKDGNPFFNIESQSEACSFDSDSWMMDVNYKLQILESWVETKMKIDKAFAFYELKHFNKDLRGFKLFRALKRIKNRSQSYNKVIAFRELQIFSLRRSSKMHFKFLYENFTFARSNPLQLPTLSLAQSSKSKKKKNQVSLKKKEEKDRYGLTSLSKQKNLFSQTFCQCFYHYYPRQKSETKISLCQKLMKSNLLKKPMQTSKSKQFWKAYQRNQRK